MARQQSSSELAGSLAATLTASLPQARAPLSSVSQNSGLLDVRALYAETLGEVMRRTRSDARPNGRARSGNEASGSGLRAAGERGTARSLEAGARGRIANRDWVPPGGPPVWGHGPAPVVVGSARPAWPRAARGSPPVRPFEPDVAFPIVLAKAAQQATARRPRGLGWFGVAVAWLATVTMGASMATAVPGHALTRLRAGALGVKAETTGLPAASPAMDAPSIAATPVALLPAPVLPAPIGSVTSPAAKVAPLVTASPAPAIATQA